MREFTEFLVRHNVAFRAEIVRPKREPAKIAIMYVGVQATDPYEYHAVPDGDYREHWPDSQCWCHPVMSEDDDNDDVWVHNAMDGRESHETGGPLH